MSDYPDLVYITKYAISVGIVGAWARHHSDAYYRVKGHSELYVMGRDIHDSPEEAVDAANAMVDKRRKQLERSLAKLRHFTADDVREPRP